MTQGRKQTGRSRLTETVRECLRKHPVFSQFRQTNWVELLQRSRIVEPLPGEVICREWQKAELAWLLLEGEVKLLRYTTKGQVLLVDLVLPGDLFGAVFYAAHPIHPVTAIAMKKVRAFAFPLVVLIDELKTNDLLQMALLEDTCIKLCQSIAMRGLGLEDVPVRIASILCRLQDKFGTIIPETRATIAELAGTTTESAIRITRAMEKEGVIRLSRGKIEVLSSDRLSEMAGASFRPLGVHREESTE